MRSACSFFLFLASTLLVWGLLAAGASADVYVLTNRTSASINAQITPRGGRSYSVSLRPGEVRPLFSDNRLRLEYTANNQRQNFPLDANGAYFFGETAAGRIGFRKIGLGGTPETTGGRKLPGKAGVTRPAVLTLKLLVDEEEVLRREVWERRLRSRVAKASAILERHAGVRLKVVAVDEWQSDNQTRSFTGSLKEFEKVVDPAPARLAIGFTSQYQTPRGRTHLGGIRGPMRSHLMIREWSRIVGEPEKLELLVHELGHFLGATHSPEPDSVMRPVLADRLSRFADFEIRFDAVNTLIIAMVGEEMRRRSVDRFDQLSAGTRSRLTEIYGSLVKAIPGDKAAARFRQLSSAKTIATSLVGQTRGVLYAITTAAKANRRLPEFERLDGDLLTERYVQAAASAAARLPDDAGPKAFLLAVAMGVGEVKAVQRGLQDRQIKQIEDVFSQSERRAALGRPSVAGRRDLAKHFFVSAGLTAGASAAQADTLGYAKEALDAQGGSGFSFVDLAANRAGIRFAEQVLAGKLRLHTLAEHFRVAHYMPPIDGLPEGLTGREVVRRFGGQGDERYAEQLAKIDARIDALPPYLPPMIGR